MKIVFYDLRVRLHTKDLVGQVFRHQLLYKGIGKICEVSVQPQGPSPSLQGQYQGPEGHNQAPPTIIKQEDSDQSASQTRKVWFIIIPCLRKKINK